MWIASPPVSSVMQNQSLHNGPIIIVHTMSTWAHCVGANKHLTGVLRTEGEAGSQCTTEGSSASASM